MSRLTLLASVFLGLLLSSTVAAQAPAAPPPVTKTMPDLAGPNPTCPVDANGKPDPDKTEDLSDTNTGDTTVFVDVKPGDGTDKSFNCQKVGANGLPVGSVIEIAPGHEHTFILAKGEKVVGWDRDNTASEDQDKPKASVTTYQ